MVFDVVRYLGDGYARAIYKGENFLFNDKWEPMNNIYIKSFAIDAPPVE